MLYTLNFFPALTLKTAIFQLPISEWQNTNWINSMRVVMESINMIVHEIDTLSESNVL